MLAKIWALIALLTKLVDLWEAGKRGYKAAKVKLWSKELKEHAEKVENAQTDEERRNLASAGSDILRKPESDSTQD